MSPVAPDTNRLCAEEDAAQSRTPGPGPVADHEHLARVVLHPTHLSNGGLARHFLKIDHLLSDGWSFMRLEIAGERGVMAHGEKLAARRPDQKAHGYAVIKTSEFRAIQDAKGRRAFCILDDESEDTPAHAIAKPSIAGRQKGELRGLRACVLDILQRNLKTR